MSSQNLDPCLVIRGPGIEQLSQERLEMLQIMFSGLELTMTRGKIITDNSGTSENVTSDLGSRDRLFTSADFVQSATGLGLNAHHATRVVNILWREFLGDKQYPKVVHYEDESSGSRRGPLISLVQLRNALPMLTEEVNYIRGLGPGGLSLLEQIVDAELTPVVATE